MNRQLRYLMMLLLMVFTAGAYAEVKVIDYSTSMDGITLSGTTEQSTVKINENKNTVNSIALKNTYLKDGAMNGNHIKLTVEGGFKKGDVLTIAGAINNSEETKWGTVVLFTSADEKAATIIKDDFENFINGKLVEDNPKEQTYTLDADYEVLYLGRNGNTTTHLTLIKVTREGEAVEPEPSTPSPFLIDYPNKEDGITISGTTAKGTVKIHKDNKAVNCISLKNTYLKDGAMNGNHIKLTVDGGFKKGDVLTIAGAINNSEETKWGTVVLFTSADEKAATIIKDDFENFINGQLVEDDPEPQTYTLEKDYDVLYLGRNGNTTTNLTLITLKRESPLFHETFDKIDETGGNDDAFSGQVANKALNTTEGVTDEEWTKLEKVYKGKQCAKFGTGSADGILTTRAIALKGEGGLTFRAAGWGSGTNTLSVKALKGDGSTLVTETFTLENSKWKNYTIAINEADGNLVLEFSGRRGFIDDIVVEEGKVVTKEDIELSFDPTILEVTQGEENFNEPLLVKPSDFTGTVTYSIEDEDVATIDPASGKLTIIAVGNTTVKAKTSEDDKYYAGEASYTLRVMAPTFYDIAGIKGLTSGSVGMLKLDNAQVLYANGSDMYVKDASGAIDFYFKKTNSFNYKEGDILNGTAKVTYLLYNNGLPEITKVENTEITATDGTAVPTEEEVVNVTLEKYMCDLVKVKGTFKVNGKNYFVTDGTNDLQVYDKFKLGQNNEKLDLSKVADGATVTITGIVVPFNNKPEIAITKLEVEEPETITAKISDAGYATLFYGTKALNVPKGVKAYTATVNETSIVPGTTYEEGDVIPAGEAVILEGAAGDYTFTVAANNSASPTTGNMLYGSDEDATTTGPAGSKFFKLAVGPQGVGFYYGATGGAPFTSAAHKAYLAVPGDTQANFFLFDTNGIHAVRYGINKDDIIYNLQGVRIDAGNLSKGIYIVNGKKVIVK